MPAILEAPGAVDWAQLREQAQLTVDELAELTALDKATIARLELGGRVNESTRRLVLVALRRPDAVREAIA